MFRIRHKSLNKVLTAATSFIFLFSSLPIIDAPAQVINALNFMPAPGTPVHLTNAFRPAFLKGMVIDPKDPFKFDFIVYRGDQYLTQAEKKQQYNKLIKYFLAAMTVPDNDQWVNLSPYEKNRTIPREFGLTEMGRDLLAQDYLLKQLSSSLINPDTGLGKKFWDNVFQKAYQQLGTTNIPVKTFNKVWIVPERATLYEKDNTVYVINSHLKVMMEEDYLSMKKHGVSAQEYRSKNGTVSISNQVMRQIIIPALEQEVNEGKNFAPLRQVFSSMLLATWYKKALRESILARLYADKDKVKGVDQNPKNNEKIYQEYVSAFKVGAFNMIKEDVDRLTNETIPRKYFSGGIRNTYANVMVDGDRAMAVGDFAQNSFLEDIVSTRLNRTQTAPQLISRQGRLKQLIRLFGPEPMSLNLGPSRSEPGAMVIHFKPNPDATNYKVYSLEPDGKRTLVQTINKRDRTQFTVFPSAGTSYVVKAYDAAQTVIGEGEMKNASRTTGRRLFIKQIAAVLSIPVAEKVLAPLAIAQTPTATTQGTNSTSFIPKTAVELRWTPTSHVDLDGNPDIHHYDVYFGKSEIPGTFTDVRTVPANRNSIDILGVSGQEGTYQVIAKDKFNNTIDSTPVQEFTTPLKGDFEPLPSGKGYRLTFIWSEALEGKNVTVKRGPSIDGPWTEEQHQPIPIGNNQYYIDMFDAQRGESVQLIPPEAPVAPLTIDTRVSVPKRPRIIPNPIVSEAGQQAFPRVITTKLNVPQAQAQFTSSNGLQYANPTVYLSWLPSTTASPAITNYNVYYSTKPATQWQTSADYTKINAGNATQYALSGLIPGNPYYIVVTAQNANGESGYSNMVSMYMQPKLTIVYPTNPSVAGSQITMVFSMNIANLQQTQITLGYTNGDPNSPTPQSGVLTKNFALSAGVTDTNNPGNYIYAISIPANGFQANTLWTLQIQMPAITLTQPLTQGATVNGQYTYSFTFNGSALPAADITMQVQPANSATPETNWYTEGTAAATKNWAYVAPGTNNPTTNTTTPINQYTGLFPAASWPVGMQVQALLALPANLFESAVDTWLQGTTTYPAQNGTNQDIFSFNSPVPLTIGQLVVQLAYPVTTGIPVWAYVTKNFSFVPMGTTTVNGVTMYVYNVETPAASYTGPILMRVQANATYSSTAPQNMAEAFNSMNLTMTPDRAMRATHLKLLAASALMAGSLSAQQHIPVQRAPVVPKRQLRTPAQPNKAPVFKPQEESPQDQPTVTAGQSITIPINFSSVFTGGQQVAALQLALQVPSGWSVTAVTAGPAAATYNKTIAYDTAGGLVLLYGLNATPIGTGSDTEVILYYTISIPANAQTNTYALGLTNVVGATPDGSNVTINSNLNPGSVLVNGLPPNAPNGLTFYIAGLKPQGGGKTIDKFVALKVLNPGDRATSDQAMLKGGIDLNSANMAMLIKRDGKGVPLPISQQDLENIHFDGLVPRILSIKSAQGVVLFSGPAY